MTADDRGPCEICGANAKRCTFGRPSGPCTCWRGTPCRPMDAARAAFLSGAPIGSPERPAIIGGLPFVAAPRPNR